MKTKQTKIISVFVFLMAAALLLSSPAFAQFNKSATCPIMPDEKVQEKYHCDYQGKTYYFCCRPCIKQFKKNPEKYLSEHPELSDI